MNSSSRSNDDDLLRRLSDGDEEAFMTIYRRHQAPLYRFALRLSGAAAVAEDVTQETFLALLGGRGGYDPGRGALRSYLFGVARNQVLKRLERARLESPPPANGHGGHHHHGETRPAGEDVAAVREALGRLPIAYREVVVLCELEGESYEDAAAICGVPVGTIRSRLHRARAQLAATLGDAPVGVAALSRTAAATAPAPAARPGRTEP